MAPIKSLRTRKNVRRGVSAVLAETLMIAVALSVGFALWGYVNGVSASAQQAYSQNIVESINQINERYMIAHAKMSTNQVTVYFYNQGNLATSIKSIWIWDQTLGGTPSQTFTGSPLPLALPSNAVTQVTLNLSFQITPGDTYYLKAQGYFGNICTYYQVA